jgi:nucleoside-diphosphate-sugar epimerase
MPGLPASWKNLQTYIECNVTATGNVLQAMVADNVPRIVHASTSSVYGKVAVGSETSQIDPVSPYGVTKLAAEGLVRSFCLERGLSSSILRYFSVFGPGQRPDMAFNIFIKKLLAGEPVTVFGDGLAARRNTYVSDCVMATAEVIERAPSAPVFNVSGTEVASVLDVLRLLQGISGKEFRVEFLPARAGDQRLTDGDSSLLTESTGWSPRVSLRDGLADQFAWQADGCRAEFGAPLLDVLENAPNANNSGSTP